MRLAWTQPGRGGRRPRPPLAANASRSHRMAGCAGPEFGFLGRQLEPQIWSKFNEHSLFVWTREFEGVDCGIEDWKEYSREKC